MLSDLSRHKRWAVGLRDFGVHIGDEDVERFFAKNRVLGQDYEECNFPSQYRKMLDSS